MVKIGVDLGGTKIAIGAVDEKGRIMKMIRIPTDVKGGAASVINQIVEGVNHLSLPFETVGIGVAGQVDFNGIVTFAPNLFWTDVPLAQKLLKVFSKPVFVMNDVRAATVAEWRFGAGRGCHDLLCVFIGTGIGGGAVIGGHLIEGVNNSALELGHMVIDQLGPLCTCGNVGCFEALCGGLGLSRRFKEAFFQAGDSFQGPFDVKLLIQMRQQKNKLAIKIIEEAFSGYVAALTSLVNLFNPKVLILGGGMIEGLPEIVDVVKKGIQERALKTARVVDVVRAELAEPTVIGAALWQKV